MRSMTGYGSGKADSPIGSVSVEARSVNSRFLEVSLKLPSEFSSFEPLIRTELQNKLHRGKIYLSVHFAPVPGTTQRYEVNTPLLKTLEDYCRQQGSEPTLDRLLTIPGVVLVQQSEEKQDDLKALLEKALADAVKSLRQERAREGDALRQALESIRSDMLNALAIVEEGRPLVVQKYRERLHERLEEMLGAKASTMDAGRLEQEVAMFTDKADIGEEVVRLRVHLDRLHELLTENSEASTGRQLEFLNQEILREINTIGSKCRDLDITRQVLELKNLAENIREQIANVE